VKLTPCSVILRISGKPVTPKPFATIRNRLEILNIGTFKSEYCLEAQNVNLSNSTRYSQMKTNR